MTTAVSLPSRSHWASFRCAALGFAPLTSRGSQQYRALTVPELTQQMFDLLLGDNLQGRKDHIAENGYKYLDQLDVS